MFVVIIKKISINVLFTSRYNLLYGFSFRLSVFSGGTFCEMFVNGFQITDCNLYAVSVCVWVSVCLQFVYVCFWCVLYNIEIYHNTKVPRRK